MSNAEGIQMNTTELIALGEESGLIHFNKDVGILPLLPTVEKLAKFAELLAKRNAPIEDERKAFEAWLKDTGKGWSEIALSAWQYRASLPAEQDAELTEPMKKVLSFAMSQLQDFEEKDCLDHGFRRTTLDKAFNWLRTAIANRKDGV